MRNNIKYSVSLFAVVLSLILGNVVYAVEDTSKDVSDPVTKVEKENNLKDEFKKGMEGIKDNKEENKIKRDEFKNGIEEDKAGLKATMEGQKTELQSIIEGIKTNREEFKKEMELNKEEFKIKIETARAEFKANLIKMKDENKKAIVANVVTTIDDLNAKLTDQFSSKVDQIETVLVSIQSRITKNEALGANEALPKAQVIKAQEDIAAARSAILEQSKKVYTPTLGDETKLKGEMQALRDTFKADIKAVFDKVKVAHQSVKNTAVALAQIPVTETPKDEVKNGVEDTTPGPEKTN